MTNYLEIARKTRAERERAAATPKHHSEISELSEISQPTRHGWATITLAWPATSTVPCPRGKWRRLESGDVEATYTRDELRLALAAAGVDVAALAEKEERE